MLSKKDLHLPEEKRRYHENMKLSKLNLSIFLTVLFCIGISGKTFAQPSLFNYEKYINGKGDTLNYQLLVPD